MLENPYATPESEVAVPMERNDFKEIPTKELKNLRNDSHSIRAVVFLIILGLAIMVIGGGTAVISGAAPQGPELFMLLVLCGFNIAAAIGLMKRTTWGRILGFITGALMLLGFPLGTIIGIMVLVALGRGGRLFGPDRLHHKPLDAEWRHRKRNKIV